MSDHIFADFLERIRNSPAQSLIDRVEELRGRIVKSTIVLAVIFVACFAAARPIFLFLEEPLLEALPKGARNLNFTGPLDVFMAYMRVSFLLAAVIAAPMLFWQIWKYVGPALPPAQRRYVKPYFFSSIVLFLAGMAFCHFIMMPTTFGFLIGMGENVAEPTIMVTDYISLAVFMLLGFGVVFQLPIVLLILEALGVIELEHLTKHRGPIVVIILIIAAIATPTPDPFSQLALAAPMYMMFEAAIILIRIKRRRQASTPPASGDPAT